MTNTNILNDRQLRERKFFNERTKKISDNFNLESIEVSFDSILNKEQRLQNSYWFIDNIAVKNFKKDRK